MTDYKLQNYTVYYARHFSFDGRNLPQRLWVRDFLENWAAVKNIEAFGLNEIWHNMQGEVWSPNGEAREHIASLNLRHTSMSIGDIIFNHDTEKYYWVSTVGFSELVLTD